MSELAQDFVRACLAKDPAARPSIAQLLRHPWIRSYMVRGACCHRRVQICRSDLQIESRVEFICVVTKPDCGTKHV